MLSSVVRRVPSDIAACFRARNIWYHLAAVAITLLLVLFGADWAFFQATRFDWLVPLVMTAGISGFFVPVLFPVALYVWGEVRCNEELMRKATLLAESALIAWLISSFYKVFTGRLQPEFLTHLSTLDITREFHFGILQNGIFWGWPSSHAAVAVALATAVYFLFPRDRIGRYIGILFAILVSVGAAVGFHWLSDVIAGILVGFAVARTVTKQYLSTGAQSAAA